MKIVIFGLTVSSSWGNGHATLWRSLINALLRRGHQVSFYEKDTPYYANTRDLYELSMGGRLEIYTDFEAIRRSALLELNRADLAICTSYCPDGRLAAELILQSEVSIKCFYDLDTPVTLDALATNTAVDYLPLQGLETFDLVLSYTGGRALIELQTKMGARHVAPLYGSVDPELHRPVPHKQELSANLSYLGTYAADRQDQLERLFMASAAIEPDRVFLIAGSLYPASIQWSRNIVCIEHLPPQDHAALFSSSSATLNITRSVMAAYGYCPSGRLFEAAACGAVILSDWWEGLDTFFTPDKEILVVTGVDDIRRVLRRDKKELRRIGEAARTRALAEHTGESRIIELEAICSSLRA